MKKTFDDLAKQWKSEMKNENVHAHLFVPTEKWCSNHGGRAKEEGGIWITAKHKKTRRWMCAACAENRKRRIEQMKAA